MDVEKTSCYHHETVARPPRKAKKPPSLGVVTDKIDDALLEHSPRSLVVHCFWFVGLQVCALLKSGRRREQLGWSLTECAKEGERDGRTLGCGKRGGAGLDGKGWRHPYGIEMGVGIDSRCLSPQTSLFLFPGVNR